MARTTFSLIAAGLFTSVTAPLAAQDVGEFRRSAYHDYRIVTVAEGLVNPWSMAFLPNGDMLVTERPGRLRIVRHGQLLPAPVPGLPAVLARGQGGLMDVVLHPNFSSNRLLYISYSKPYATGDGATTAIIRARPKLGDRIHEEDLVYVMESITL